MQAQQEISRFLAETEKRAFRMAMIAVGNEQDALDILQDAMCKLVQKYTMRQPSEWPALFHTILQSRIRDWYRRESVRNRFRVWFGKDTDSLEGDQLDRFENPAAVSPDNLVQGEQLMSDIEKAIRQLPLRQQQAFMLRAFEEFDVNETAAIMGCSAGSVKTHYSRAIAVLRDKLGDSDNE